MGERRVLLRLTGAKVELGFEVVAVMAAGTGS